MASSGDHHNGEKKEDDAVVRMEEMGIDRADAVTALAKNENDVEKALEFIFSGQLAQTQQQQQPPVYGESSWNEDAKHLPYASVEVFEGAKKPAADDDMEMAMRNSLNDLREEEVPPKQRFRPAIDEEYDATQWTMTAPTLSRVSTGVHEIFMDPPPEERKRQPGDPVLLRNAPQVPGLGALLTVFFSIPYLRKAMLEAAVPVHVNAAETDWWSEPSPGGPIVVEVQRVFAALAASNRAYISVGGVVEEDHSGDNEGGSSIIGNWLERYDTCFRLGKSEETGQETPSLLKSNVSQVTQHGGLNPTDFCLINVAIPAGGGMSWDDVVDSLFWDQEPSEEAYLTHAANVFICAARRSDGGEGLGMDVPFAWSIEKYLEQNKEHATDLQRRRAQVRAEMGSLEHQVQHLQTLNGTHDGLKLLQTSISLLSAMDRVQPPTDDLLHDADDPSTRMGVVEKLKSICGLVEEKLREYKKEQGSLLDTLAGIKYTQEFNDPRLVYELVGVISSHSTAFFRQGELWTCASFDQEFGARRSSHVSHHISHYTPADVGEVIRTRGEEVLLVYASPQALEPCEATLNDSLKAFIQADNEAFLAELQVGTASMSSTSSSDSGHEQPDLIMLDASPHPDHKRARSSASMEPYNKATDQKLI